MTNQKKSGVIISAANNFKLMFTDNSLENTTVINKQY